MVVAKGRLACIYVDNGFLKYFFGEIVMISRIVSVALLLPGIALAGEFNLESTDVGQNRLIADKYVLNGFGCKGENVSPALSWKNAPKGTKSFAVTAYDPDAPTDSGWWHWVVFNLPANMTSLPRGSGSSGAGKLPKGVVQSKTDFGTSGWGGPCPPQGDKPHRFIFTVFALKTDRLELDENASAAMVSYMVNVNTLAKSIITSYSEHK